MKFCIVGSGRCGTSLLRHLLNRHPDVWVHPESHWLPRMIEYGGLLECDTAALLHILKNTTHTTGERVTPISDEELTELFQNTPSITVRDFADRVGEAVARRNGKSIWADKVPDYGFFMQQLQMLWPNCKFIHLIRDGRDVARSMSKHPGFQWIVTAGEATWCNAAFLRYYDKVEPVHHPLSAYACRWGHAIRRIRDESTRLTTGSYLEVRFESLLFETGATLSNLARFTGIEPDAAWLNEAPKFVDRNKLGVPHSEGYTASLPESVRHMLKDLNYG